MWAGNSSITQKTTNACESFHNFLKQSLHTSKPNVMTFLDVLKDLQLNSYIKIKSSRHSEKT